MRATFLATLIIIGVVLFSVAAKVIVSQLSNGAVLALLIVTLIAIWSSIYKALR